MQDITHILPFISLYAEIHYKFFGFSLISKNLPEVIIDVPSRLELNRKLPILILVKDSDKYPCTLMPVKAEIESGAKKKTVEITDIAENLNKPMWHKIVFYEPDKNIHGKIRINFTINLKRKKRTYTFFNSTYNTGINRPLEVYISSSHLPGSYTAVFGDIHTHSSYTSDQVEFGSPINAIVEMGKAAGLQWAAVTDHSYDLDNMQSDYLKKDPKLTKWTTFKKDVSDLNKQQPFIILPGEEVSCGNSKGRNIHLLVINNRKFIPGSGDSAEKLLSNKPDISVKNVLDRIEKQSIAFAAHPEVKIPLLQKLLLNRDSWTSPDYFHKKLTGIQILNGQNNDAFKKGIQKWISLLLSGRKISIAAGSDSHGFFNRFIHVGTAFLSVKEEYDKHIFGQMRTGVLLSKKIMNYKSLLDSIRNGNTVISSGPFMNIHTEGNYNTNAGPGEILKNDLAAVSIHCQSSPEFGTLKKCIIYAGDIVNKEESIVYEITSFENKYNFNEYIRVS